MKQIRKLMKGVMLALAMTVLGGCSDHVPVVEPAPVADDWKVYFSRSTGENLTVALRYNETISYGTLIPAADANTPATWLNDIEPTWPASGQVEVITFSPAVTELPTTVDATENIAYIMDYTTCTVDNKPASFTMTHLMAQLEVHIKLHDEAEHHFAPKDATVSLNTTATVDYSNKSLMAPYTRNYAFSLGTFTKEGDDNTATDENWVNTAQVVIPQTLEAGTPCLTFKAGEHTYVFTPDNDITLIAGKKTRLYLGVAYQNAYVTLGDVTVADWNDGGFIEGGVAE